MREKVVVSKEVVVRKEVVVIKYVSRHITVEGNKETDVT